MQLCVPHNGKPYGLIREHTVTLISSEAAVCVHVQPILGHANEIGAMPALLDRLREAYKHTRIFEQLTLDAGNTSLEVASQIRSFGWSYFAQIKANHGELYREAARALGARSEEQAGACYADKENGKAVEYHAFCPRPDGGWLARVDARPPTGARAAHGHGPQGRRADRRQPLLRDRS